MKKSEFIREQIEDLMLAGMGPANAGTRGHVAARAAEKTGVVWDPEDSQEEAGAPLRNFRSPLPEELRQEAERVRAMAVGLPPQAQEIPAPDQPQHHREVFSVSRPAGGRIEYVLEDAAREQPRQWMLEELGETELPDEDFHPAFQRMAYLLGQLAVAYQAAQSAGITEGRLEQRDGELKGEVQWPYSYDKLALRIVVEARVPRQEPPEEGGETPA